MTDGFNLAEHVLRAGRATPDKLAMAILSPTGAERWSYARLTSAVRGAATGLLAHGLRPGDRVLLRIGNQPAFPVAYLACIAAGLVHDLSHPIQNINNNCKLILQMHDDPEYRATAVKFVKASIKGWAYCRDNAQACADLVVAQLKGPATLT